MSEYLKMLHEVEATKLELEQELCAVVGASVAKWQAQHGLAVKNIYIDLALSNAVNEPKQYVVTSVMADLDYKP